MRSAAAVSPNRAVLAAAIACVLAAAGGTVWAARLMESLGAYRSPLHATAPESGGATGTPLARRVVIVLVDGLREDTARRAEVMPFLDELRRSGAWATMHSRPPSYSAPSYTTLFTGAWPDISDGPALNVDYEQIPAWTQDDLFSAAHRAGLRTAVSGYYWFERLIPQASVDVGFYTAGEDHAADRTVVDAALQWLRTGDAHLVLVHLDQVDYAGHHEGGPRDPRWDQAAGRVDGCSELRLWWEVALPIVRPMIGAYTLLSFMGTWNSFLWPQIILQDERKYTLPIGLANMIGLPGYDTSYGTLMAGTLLSILPVAILFFVLQRDFISGLASGAVKG